MFCIKSGRLTLRDLVLDDWKLFYDLMQEPETRRYMGDYLKAETEDEAKKWVTQTMAFNNETPRHSYNLAIEFNDEAIGWIGIGEAQSEEKKDLDFGYALKKTFWGNGFMTEALQSVIKYCFDSLPIQRITGECESSNIASQKVMQKSGMNRIKTYVFKDEESGQEKEKIIFHIDKP